MNPPAGRQLSQRLQRRLFSAISRATRSKQPLDDNVVQRLSGIMVCELWLGAG
jgi:hypothetical protein